MRLPIDPVSASASPECCRVTTAPEHPFHLRRRESFRSREKRSWCAMKFETRCRISWRSELFRFTGGSRFDNGARLGWFDSDALPKRYRFPDHPIKISSPVVHFGSPQYQPRACPQQSKRPPGNIQRPAGLKIACFRKMSRPPRFSQNCIWRAMGANQNCCSTRETKELLRRGHKTIRRRSLLSRGISAEGHRKTRRTIPSRRDVPPARMTNGDPAEVESASHYGGSADAILGRNDSRFCA
jgi:hypothetical protein